METLVAEVFSIVPELGLALVIVWFVLKRDELWRSALTETTKEWKGLTEQTVEKYETLTEKMGKEYQDFTRELVQENRKEYQDFTREIVKEKRAMNGHLEAIILAATEAMTRMCAIDDLRQELSKAEGGD